MGAGLEIGILALQGAFIEHRKMIETLGATAREVRLPEHLDGLGGLIIPGGESTTIGKLAVSYGLIGPLRDFALNKPTWGTCAGMIFLAKDIGGDRQPLLGVMDLRVNRNAFGRQIDSFERDLDIAGIEGGPFHAIFIRAPVATSAGTGVDVMARLDDGSIVAARQGHLLATAFHPELSGDSRVHQFFLELVASTRESNLRRDVG